MRRPAAPAEVTAIEPVAVAFESGHPGVVDQSVDHCGAATTPRRRSSDLGKGTMRRPRAIGVDHMSDSVRALIARSVIPDLARTALVQGAALCPYAADLVFSPRDRSDPRPVVDLASSDLGDAAAVVRALTRELPGIVASSGSGDWFVF